MFTSNSSTTGISFKVDFASVLTMKNQKLFLQEPVAIWDQQVKKQKGPTPLEFNDGRIFSASVKNPLEGDTIIFNYKMNWDSLFTSFEARTKDSIEMPELQFGGF